MKNPRCFYSASLHDFFSQSKDEVLGVLNANSSSAETTLQQEGAWSEEIEILQRELASLGEGRILFEYVIPRRGKRVDVVVLYCNIVFLLEFKCGEQRYQRSALDQVCDYALDLHHFQEASHETLLVPLLVATRAKEVSGALVCRDRVLEPIGCNAHTIASRIREVCEAYPDEPPLDYVRWEHAAYCPTPTIVEAAQALYLGHGVEAITRSDAGAKNLTRTTVALDAIIARSRLRGEKAICFVTGVPGAGKTLVGLNLAVHHSHGEQMEPAVFLSGNYPLVEVLQEALARDKCAQLKEKGKRVHKKDIERETSTFIQIIHQYRDFFVNNTEIPPERVAIFDEAQRAWTHQHIATFMKTKKGILDFKYSEPEFLIQTMDRHKGWAVIVCLVGGGQEINDGEAGLPEWFAALRRSFPAWRVYVSPELNDDVYTRGQRWEDLLAGLKVSETRALHLASSIRSFRTPDLSAFVDALLNHDCARTLQLRAKIGDTYPLVITRDLNRARAWLREKCRGSTRCGMLASSGALRLKAEGLFVKSKIDEAEWFLDGKDDVRSSYQLEDVATEFAVQGLELDFTLVAWDADFCYQEDGWLTRTFRGARWQRNRQPEQIRYRKNAYRVLLTRARQGMVLFVPHGSRDDATRMPAYYDSTYAYLTQMGFEPLQ